MSDYIINFTDPLKGSFVIRPYTSNGPKFPTTNLLNSTSIAANSTLLLYGKGHPEYGERTDENLLNLLENFSGATEPVIKVTGMLWHREVLYYRDTVGGDWYAYSTSWNTISVTPGAEPANPSDGDYWWDNTGSPTVLYQYSADERNINDWIVRVFEEASGAPTGNPTRELQVYNGSTWNTILDETSIVSSYLLLDASNGPLTGDLEIATTTPTLTLTGDDAIIDMVGADPTIRLSGGTYWQILGDDATNVLEVRVGVTPNTNTHFVIDNANDYLTHGNHISAAQYATNITGVDEALVNVRYANSLVFGAISGDTAVDGGTFGLVGSPASGTLTLTFTTAGSPEFTSDVVISGFDSDNIAFTSGLVGGVEPAATVDEALTKAAPLNNPTFTGTVIVPTLTGASASNEAADKGYVDAAVVAAATGILEAQRHIATITDAVTPVPPVFQLPFTYAAGQNRLFVFKNGVKQYHDNVAFDTALFSTPKESATAVTGLEILTIAGVVTGLGGTWTLSGDQTSSVGIGDTFEIQGNTGGGDGSYTVASVIGVGSPITQTNVIVTGTIPGGATADGNFGLDYEFDLNLDSTTLTVGPISAFNAQTFGGLIGAMQTAVDSVFGPNTATVYLHGGNIRIQTTTLPGTGSPPFDGVAMLNLGGSPLPTTRDLFDVNNLGLDGFTSFYRSGTPVLGTQLGYYEDDGTGLPTAEGGLAVPGSAASVITLNDAVTGFDVLEFILI